MVVLNTNNFKASDTANGGTPMATALPPNTTLVDVLDPNLATYATDANSNLLISNIPAQTAKILIPQGQVVAARN
jgi:hypothetical protein